MSDYSPDLIPGLETEHPAQVRPGLVAPEHDRPEPVAPDKDSIMRRINQVRELKRIMAQDWRTDPLGMRLYVILKDDHAMLGAPNDTGAVYLRRLIEELIPSLRVAYHTDTQRLEWLMSYREPDGVFWSREAIDHEMQR